MIEIEINEKDFTFHFGPGDWFRLPLALRQRWWAETNYGTLEPSELLRAALTSALSVGNDR